MLLRDLDLARLFCDRELKVVPVLQCMPIKMPRKKNKILHTIYVLFMIDASKFHFLSKIIRKTTKDIECYITW